MPYKYRKNHILYSQSGKNNYEGVNVMTKGKDQSTINKWINYYKKRDWKVLSNKC